MGWLSDPDLAPSAPRNTAQPSTLHPADILWYTLHTDSISCACGQVHVSSRLLVTYKIGTARDSRPCGKSETLYAKKEVKQLFTSGGTPICAVCIDAPRHLEAWSPKAASAGITGASNFAPGQSTERLKAALKASISEAPVSSLLD